MTENEGQRKCELRVAEPVQNSKIVFMRIKVIATSVSLFLKLTASFVVAAYEGWMRRKYEIVKKLKERVKLCVISVVPVNLITSLIEIVIYRGNMESFYHVFSIISLKPKVKWLPKKGVPDLCIPEPEKSVNCEVLYAPEGVEIRADVIFIHGLHGSVVHTWKQGLWSYRKNVENSPLKHKYQLSIERDLDGESAINSKPNCFICDRCECINSAGRCDHTWKQELFNNEDHDIVLENITDILNNIDDTIKETKRSTVHDEPEVEPYSPCWPRDWLPKDCPRVRVIAVNYTTDPFLWRPVWITKRIRTSMIERSEEMEDHLLKLGVGQNPIIWVGHSKGGLFVKQMLVDGEVLHSQNKINYCLEAILNYHGANNSNDPALNRFIDQTKGIMFYSVPHRGSSLAHLNLPLLRQSVELTEVKKDSSELINLHNQFMEMYQKKILSAEVYSFVETVLTFMFITNVRVVSVDSADIGFGVFQGVNIDHREICKPLNRDCFLYTELVNLINRVV